MTGDYSNSIQISTAINEGWIRGLFISDGTEQSAKQYGSSGTSEAVPAKGNSGMDRQRIPDKWRMGLKLVAWECAAAIIDAGNSLTGPALWDAIAASERVKVTNDVAMFKDNNASLVGGEVSAKATTIKKDWHGQLKKLIG